MNPLLRSVLAVILGSVVAAVLVAGVEALGHVVYSPPPGLDTSDPASIRAAMASMPVGALLFVLLAWGVGSFGGAWLAARLARRAPVAHGLVIGGLLLAAGVANMLLLPHPAWFWVAGVQSSLPPHTLGLGSSARGRARMCNHQPGLNPALKLTGPAC